MMTFYIDRGIIEDYIEVAANGMSYTRLRIRNGELEKVVRYNVIVTWKKEKIWESRQKYRCIRVDKKCRSRVLSGM